VAAALYQNRTALAPQTTSVGAQRAVYERYERVLRLLKSDQPMAAAELLASFPEERLGLGALLLTERSDDYPSGMLYLHIGNQLVRHATAASRRGATYQARVLIDSCELLRKRLERGGTSTEPLTERTQRLQVARLLHECTRRAEASLVPAALPVSTQIS
jgi:hypothetical protein